jgi:hypothetical protein
MEEVKTENIYEKSLLKHHMVHWKESKKAEVNKHIEHGELD